MCVKCECMNALFLFTQVVTDVLYTLSQYMSTLILIHTITYY